MQINLSQKTLTFRKPLLTKDGEEKLHHYIGIMMTDDKGQRIGMGECAPLAFASSDSDAYVRMSDVAGLINKAMASKDYADFLRPYPALLFALESAMYDYQHSPMLYDTPFAQSQAGIPLVGNVPAGSFDEMFSETKQLMLHGYRCVKINLGGCGTSLSPERWADTLRLLEKIRSRFSKDALQIRIDANGVFAANEAQERIDELAKYGIHSVEQPLAQYQWKEMAALCSSSPVPIVLDEELIGVNTLAEKCALLDTIRPQFIAVKPTLHGGMAGSIEWISEAQKRGVGSWLASAYESNIGIRNIALLAARIYGCNPTIPQDIDTSWLYKDNIEMDLEQRNNKLWRCEVEE